MEENEKFVVIDMLKEAAEINSAYVTNNYVLSAINSCYGWKCENIYKTTKQEESKFYPDYCLNSNILNLNNIFVEETRVYATLKNKNQDPFKTHVRNSDKVEIINVMENNENMQYPLIYREIPFQTIKFLAFDINKQIISKTNKKYNKEVKNIILLLTHRINVGIKYLNTMKRDVENWTYLDKNLFFHLSEMDQDFFVNKLLAKLRKELISLSTDQRISNVFIGYILTINLYDNNFVINLSKLLEKEVLVKEAYIVEFCDFCELNNLSYKM